MRWGAAESGAGRVRVTPRLIAVADDSPLWSEEYEVELTEVFRVQSDIAQRVTAALDLALRAPERASIAAAGHDHAGGVRLLSPGQRIRRPQLQPRQHRGGGGSVSPGGGAGLDFRAGLGPAQPGHSAMYWFATIVRPRGSTPPGSRWTRASAGSGPGGGQIARGYHYYWGTATFPAR